MEKDDLIQAIYNHIEFLKTSIEQTKQDIAYQKDLLNVYKKHNRNSITVEDEIEKLETRLQTLENIQETFNDDLEEQDVDVEEIKKYCER